MTLTVCLFIVGQKYAVQRRQYRSVLPCTVVISVVKYQPLQIPSTDNRVNCKSLYVYRDLYRVDSSV